jgi:hypothetical protein
MSMYPYPTGELEEILDPWQLEQILQDCNVSPTRVPDAFFLRSIWTVDITPPKDILIPYLFAREGGVLKQDLLPKKIQTYTGVDIQEALALGYRIDAIHGLYYFQSLENIFKDYIDMCFKGKQRAPKESAEYFLYKGLMNGLSGKFSQMLIWLAHTIMVSASVQKSRGYSPNTQSVKVVKLYDEPIGAFVVYKKLDNEVRPFYPTHITAFITSHARAFMSRVMRELNGYKDPQHTFFYTDTDSLILHARTSHLIAPYVGNDLGKFEDELKGKIVEAVFIGKKTYALTYFTGGPTHEMKLKIRCKGIPHLGASLKVTDYDIEPEWLTEQQALIKDTPSNIDIKRRCYEEKKRNGTRAIYKHLSTEVFSRALYDRSIVTCYYGSIKRNMADKDETTITLRSTWLSRRLVGDRGTMWDRRDRYFNEETGVSYPLGHQEHVPLDNNK